MFDTCCSTLHRLNTNAFMQVPLVLRPTHHARVAAAAATASAGQPGAPRPQVLCLVKDPFHLFLPSGPHCRPHPLAAGQCRSWFSEGRTTAAAAREGSRLCSAAREGSRLCMLYKTAPLCTGYAALYTLDVTGYAAPLSAPLSWRYSSSNRFASSATLFRCRLLPWTSRAYSAAHSYLKAASSPLAASKNL